MDIEVSQCGSEIVLVLANTQQFIIGLNDAKELLKGLTNIINRFDMYTEVADDFGNKYLVKKKP